MAAPSVHPPSGPATEARRRIPALKVKQWIPDWEKIRWNSDEDRSRPEKEWFYQFSMAAADLKSLSGIYRRTTDRRHAKEDPGIQRRHEPRRSATIRRYVKAGYPWSDLSDRQRDSGDFDDLRQPGWLPTAIVVNLLVDGDQRHEQEIPSSDIVRVIDQPDSSALLEFPANFGRDWTYKTIPPIEVIDGQHRLWAFDDHDDIDFDVPVVAFVGLDVSWQAYLFYTINIKPKKINQSLAFDLYPLLREEKWLTRFEGPLIYRETRAQELVDLLWATPQSPWHRRINMLGDPGHRNLQVGQAAWIRSLLVSFVKKWEGQRISIGGLFGTRLHDQSVLSWDLYTQAAFLVLIGTDLQAAIEQFQNGWAAELRAHTSWKPGGLDPAFFGRHNLLNQDQGVRTLLQVANDVFFVSSPNISFAGFSSTPGDNTLDQDGLTATARVRHAYTELRASEIGDRSLALAQALASYDWRASSAPGLSSDEEVLKQSFRGSGGYRQMRESVLRHLSEGEGWVADAATGIRARLGYD